MNKEKNDLISEFFVLQNLVTEEKNYIEILKGYCEHAMDKSDDYNKIYPFLEIIYELQVKITKQAEKFISGL